MSINANTTSHHATVAQHHDYTAGLVDQLVDIAAQLQNIAGQLKTGHTAMGTQLDESMTALLNEAPPGNQ